VKSKGEIPPGSPFNATSLKGIPKVLGDRGESSLVITDVPLDDTESSSTFWCHREEVDASMIK
jgi:hypothetical protein